MGDSLGDSIAIGLGIKIATVKYNMVPRDLILWTAVVDVP